MPWHYEPGRPFNAGRHWSKREERVVLSLRHTLSIEELAERLCREPKAVQVKLTQLCKGEKSRKVRLWTKDEDQELCKFYGELTASELGKRLGRPRRSVIGRAKRLRDRNILQASP